MYRTPNRHLPSGADNYADLERWLRRLRMLGLVLPVAFVAALPLLWPSNWHVAAGLVGVVAVVIFSRAMFSAIHRGYLQMLASQERAVDAERQAAVLEERERIAREMHDSLAQVLSVAHLKLRTIEASPELSEATRAEVSELAALCQESCSDVRESILGLRETGRAGRDFVGGIEHFLRTWSRTSGIAATLTVTPSDAQLPLTPAQEVQLSRVLQEALTNVRKHSGADHARCCCGPKGPPSSPRSATTASVSTWTPPAARTAMGCTPCGSASNSWTGPWWWTRRRASAPASWPSCRCGGRPLPPPVPSRLPGGCHDRPADADPDPAGG